MSEFEFRGEPQEEDREEYQGIDNDINNKFSDENPEKEIDNPESVEQLESNESVPDFEIAESLDEENKINFESDKEVESLSEAVSLEAVIEKYGEGDWKKTFDSNSENFVYRYNPDKKIMESVEESGEVTNITERVSNSNEEQYINIHRESLNHFQNNSNELHFIHYTEQTEKGYRLNVTVESLGLNNEIYSQTWTREITEQEFLDLQIPETDNNESISDFDDNEFVYDSETNDSNDDEVYETDTYFTQDHVSATTEVISSKDNVENIEEINNLQEDEVIIDMTEYLDFDDNEFVYDFKTDNNESVYDSETNDGDDEVYKTDTYFTQDHVSATTEVISSKDNVENIEEINNLQEDEVIIDMTEYFETDDNLNEEVFEVEEDVLFQVKENTTEAIEFITEDNKENDIKTINYFNEDKTNEVVIDMTEFFEKDLVNEMTDEVAKNFDIAQTIVEVEKAVINEKNNNIEVFNHVEVETINVIAEKEIVTNNVENKKDDLENIKIFTDTESNLDEVVINIAETWEEEETDVKVATIDKDIEINSVVENEVVIDLPTTLENEITKTNETDFQIVAKTEQKIIDNLEIVTVQNEVGINKIANEEQIKDEMISNIEELMSVDIFAERDLGIEIVNINETETDMKEELDDETEVIKIVNQKEQIIVNTQEVISKNEVENIEEINNLQEDEVIIDMTEYFETDDNLNEEVFEVEEDVLFQVKENTTEAIEFITEDNKENDIKTINYFNEDKTNEVVIDMTEYLDFDNNESVYDSETNDSNDEVYKTDTYFTQDHVSATTEVISSKDNVENIEEINNLQEDEVIIDMTEYLDFDDNEFVYDFKTDDNESISDFDFKTEVKNEVVAQVQEIEIENKDVIIKKQETISDTQKIEVIKEMVGERKIKLNNLAENTINNLNKQINNKTEKQKIEQEDNIQKVTNKVETIIDSFEHLTNKFSHKTKDNKLFNNNLNINLENKLTDDNTIIQDLNFRTTKLNEVLNNTGQGYSNFYIPTDEVFTEKELKRSELNYQTI
ncbi:MAG TPA: hypothetical protein PLX01_02855 [Candidatus Magasanikbacteria bacterium]|nr:hypothetical protein [Candidatus Magasanikbacteria bacterium]